MNEHDKENSVQLSLSGPVKKIPCWICGGDLTLNFPTISGKHITIRAYCPKCRKPRTLKISLDDARSGDVDVNK